MQIPNRNHPIYFVGAASLCVGSAAILMHIAGQAWKTEVFWKAAALLLIGVLAALSAMVFHAVSKLYPGLNPFSSKH